MNIQLKKDLIDYLLDFVTEGRWQAILDVSSQRTPQHKERRDRLAAGRRGTPIFIAGVVKEVDQSGKPVRAEILRSVYRQAHSGYVAGPHNRTDIAPAPGYSICTYRLLSVCRADRKLISQKLTWFRLVPF